MFNDIITEKIWSSASDFYLLCWVASLLLTLESRLWGLLLFGDELRAVLPPEEVFTRWRTFFTPVCTCWRRFPVNCHRNIWAIHVVSTPINTVKWAKNWIPRGYTSLLTATVTSNITWATWFSALLTAGWRLWGEHWVITHGLILLVNTFVFIFCTFAWFIFFSHCLVCLTKNHAL